MPRVTFSCNCPQSVGEARIQIRSTGREVRVLRWPASGSRAVDLDPDEYLVRIRGAGVFGTAFGMAVTAGGTMNKFVDEIRVAPDGSYVTGARRKLVVS